MKIANGPCSWGILEFNLKVQTAGFAQVLDEMKETGYAGTELGDWGFMPTDPIVLKAELRSRGLALLGAFVPVNLKDATTHMGGIKTAVRTAHLLAEAAGNQPIIILADENGKDPARTRKAGRIMPEDGLTEDQWQVFANGAAQIAETVKHETGLRTAFHHHCAGYVETTTEIDKLLSLVDPALMGLVFDTGHYRYGGGDPLQGLINYGNRVWHFHFKDYHPKVGTQALREGWDYFTSVQRGIFCELGQGEIDFPALTAELNRLHYDGWGVVEQDVMLSLGNPRQSAMRNRQYLRSIGL
jgi:inosose dehydratase